MQEFDDTVFEDLNDDDMESSSDNGDKWSSLMGDVYKNKTDGGVIAHNDTGKLSDLIDKLLNKDKPVETPKPEPLTAAEIKVYSEKIATIIAKGSDFSYGGKNRQIESMFGKAVVAGAESVKKLVDAINKLLKDQLSDVRLEGHYSTQEESKLVDHGDIVLTSYPPQYPNARYRHTTTGSVELTLTNKQGEVEDTLSVKRITSEVEKRGMYRPQLKDFDDIKIRN